jgi:hypothetical protein
VIAVAAKTDKLELLRELDAIDLREGRILDILLRDGAALEAGDDAGDAADDDDETVEDLDDALVEPDV